MATDIIARALAANGGGGGEGSIEDIISGDGISVTGGSTKTITNVGVRSVSTSTKDGAISVNTGGTSRDVMINGLIGRRSSNGGEIFNAASIAVSNAHAEGKTTEAIGRNSHAEGNTTISSGMNSHAEGNYTEASGLNSHAGGLYTIASGDNQTVIGKYNVSDGNKAFIIGGGTSDSGKNIATVDWDGNVVLDGTVTAKDADGNEVVLGDLNGIISDVEHIKGTADGQFIYDTDEKMTKIVPDGVNKGIVAMISGKTQKSNDQLLNAPVDKITINNKVIPIPSAILNLPDYGCSAGDVYNYVDFEEMVYHHKVGSYKIGDVTWNVEIGSVVRFSSYVPKVSSSTRNTKIISDKYDEITNGEAFDSTWDNVIYIASSRVYIHDYKYEGNIDDFVLQNKFSVFNYELAEEELIDISDILMPFMLESGGTITFENEHNLDVPNVIIYEKEMK